jgi:hypothetical protein
MLWSVCACTRTGPQALHSARTTNPREYGTVIEYESEAAQEAGAAGMQTALATAPKTRLRPKQRRGGKGWRRLRPGGRARSEKDHAWEQICLAADEVAGLGGCGRVVRWMSRRQLRKLEQQVCRPRSGTPAQARSSNPSIRDAAASQNTAAHAAAPRSEARHHAPARI